MTADRDLTRSVRSWLRTDEHESADRVLETVLARLDTTPQRRPWLPVRRFAQMNKLAQAAIAAAAVLIVAIVGYNLLPRIAGSGGPGPTVPTATPRPTYPALNGQGPLAGRYTLGGGLKSRVTAEVPAGWTTDTDWVFIGPSGNGAPRGMAVRFYPVTEVFKNPLAVGEGVLPGIGPTAADLADAIAADPAWAATRLVDVTIDGRPARHLTFTVTRVGADGQFDMFSLEGSPDTWGFSIGQVFDLYIVDVGSERVVIDAYRYPGTPAGDLAAQQAVIDSIQLDPRP